MPHCTWSIYSTQKYYVQGCVGLYLYFNLNTNNVYLEEDVIFSFSKYVNFNSVHIHI